MPGSVERVTERGHAQNPAAVGEDAVVFEPRPGVKHLDVR
jgi:hypothetical protein